MITPNPFRSCRSLGSVCRNRTLAEENRKGRRPLSGPRLGISRPSTVRRPIKRWLLLAGLCFSLSGVWGQSPAFGSERENLLRVRGEFEDGLYGLAIQHANRFLRDHPESLFLDEIRFILGSSRLVENEREQAVETFEALIELHPDSPYREDAFPSLVKALAGLKKYRKAYDANELFLIEYPKSERRDEARLESLRLRYSLGFYESYVHDYARYETIGVLPQDEPTRGRFDFFQAVALFRLDRHEQAQPLIKSMLRRELSSESRAFLDIALVTIEKKKKGYSLETVLAVLNRSKDYYREETIRDEFDFEAVRTIRESEATESVSPEQYEEGLEMAERLAEKPSNGNRKSELRYLVAWFSHRAGKPEKAKDALVALEQDDPAFFEAERGNFLLAEVSRSLGDESEARTRMEEGLKTESDEEASNRVRLGLARMHLEHNEIERAIDVLAEIAYSSTEYENSRYHFLKARAHFLKKEYLTALSHYERIEPSAEEFPLIFNEFLESMVKGEAHDDFFLFMDARFGEIPKDKKNEALRLKHELLFSKTEYCGRLVAEWEAVLSLNEGLDRDPWARIFYADCHLRAGNEEAYAVALELAFDLYGFEQIPEKLELAEKLSEFYSERENYEALADVYDRAIPLIENEERRDATSLFVARLWEEHLEADDDSKAETRRRYRELHEKGESSVHFEASFLLGELYLKANEPEKALAVLLEAASRLPTTSNWYPVVNHRIAQIYSNEASWENALEFYERVASSPDDSPRKRDALAKSDEIKNYLEQLRLRASESAKNEPPESGETEKETSTDI